MMFPFAWVWEWQLSLSIHPSVLSLNHAQKHKDIYRQCNNLYFMIKETNEYSITWAFEQNHKCHLSGIKHLWHPTSPQTIVGFVTGCRGEKTRSPTCWSILSRSIHHYTIYTQALKAFLSCLLNNWSSIFIRFANLNRAQNWSLLHMNCLTVWQNFSGLPISLNIV